MEIFEQFISSWWQIASLALCAMLIGMSKTGIQGIATISIPLMALAFGAKESTGVVLPILCFADLIAVIYYRRDAEWKYVFKLLPAAVAGFFVAIYIDTFIPADFFRHLMAFCILAGLLVMFWTERGGARMERILSSWWYAPAFGLLGGFTTMIGNAAGPVMAVYLLSMRLPKLKFVGTNAWFFLVVNYLKIPLQIFAWDNINIGSLAIDAIAIPFIFIGAYLGIKFVKRLPEGTFRKFIIAMTIFSTLAMLF